MNENKTRTLENIDSSKRRKFENLLQGNYLNTIQLETKIKKGNSKINTIFLIVCTLFFTGMLCTALLLLRLYRFI